MPNLIGGIVLGYIWQLIFNGILAKYSTALALNQWLGFWGLIILVSWQQIGYMMIIYIAGLLSIPGEVMEAAQIDGANSWQCLWKVTIPMMMPSITICTFLSITNGFKLFDQNLSLTAGEPSKLSEMMALNIYNTFYGRSGWEGVGQAKAVIFFVIVVAIGLIQLRATRSKEVQQLMKNKKTLSWIGTIFFTILGLIYIAPIIIVLLNSFKKKSFINLEPFKLPSAKNFIGLDNYTTALDQYGLLKAVGWTVFITVGSDIVILICTSMSAWAITRVKHKFTNAFY